MPTETIYRWYTRDGVPLIEKTNKVGETVISVSSPYNAITDILVTEEDYDIALAAYEAGIQAQRDAGQVSHNANIVARRALLDSAASKLESGTPLTEDEAEALTIS